MAQDMTKQINKLNELVALDIDAVSAYEEAISRISVTLVQNQLREFQSDHRRHIADLSDVVSQMGGTPRLKADIKGFFIKGFTAVTSMMGDEAALRAMLGNEQLTNHTYAKALEENWTEQVRSLLQKNYQDEQRHLGYIQDTLRERSWTRGQTVRP